jgi:hypothetical protein
MPSGLIRIRINLELCILYTVGKIPWTSDSAVARPLPKQDNTNTEETYTDIHTSNWIRTYDRSVCVGEYILYLKQQGHFVILDYVHVNAYFRVN